ncbi:MULTISPECIES: hypothetical protein [Mesonia]|uniref:Uncharacterized protein n=1 Tax=Mesonia oceanica TaxID=2687242 RepID=A0AC61Y565_9FLAO|nr:MULTISPECIES: hypothetical protein [Mesonia]MAN28808.1 hypothetical protein [Mesonia sp.]MAQ41860.1 hypothetical protein [Mesonia sp.]MBJ99017.1 hypothetical protein [Flavobacteriaceae bacterium]VVU99217.1 hypothetical protein FVB9532_00469 [Mesonia oceanica]|tara:strand:+ start:72049 stop:72966 length:918 start_codon:yes stop_codon:yes gene_type:complete
MILKDIHRRRKEGYKPNTFIGGVGASINSIEKLAELIGINESIIKFFENEGVNISFCIIEDYHISRYKFRNDGQYKDWGHGDILTYYIDIEGKLKSIGENSLQSHPNLELLYLPGILTLKNSAIRQNGYDFVNLKSLKELGKRCFNGSHVTAVLSIAPLGEDGTESGIFKYINDNVTIYCPIENATINNGEPDGDIQYLLERGSNVVYVKNYTPSEKILDLSISNLEGSTCRLYFTPPNSINPLDFYEVYIDDGSVLSKYKPFTKILESGQTITGLASGHLKISIKAVDVYYNLSEKSNEVLINV